VRPVLSKSFYARDTVRVARGLLGCVLETRIRGTVAAGRIVEVEAYVGPHDPAGHGFGNRRTARNAGLFGPPGTAYVYFIYGMYWCVNAVTERDGYPAAVLIRALEPLDGLPVMRRRRGIADDRLLCSGPGRLCQALGITGALNGEALDGDRIRILRPAGPPARRPVVTPRIGITRAADWPLRFILAGSPWTWGPATGGPGPGRAPPGSNPPAQLLGG
jgi:DNA-3-methyladenine glycosylase